ncbi:sorbitol dehydrogenase-2-like protein [Hyaloraphidium curvatum]|nr:sorbitol dehydrogenase-2-like protein [Hyaloraphidium curvatum]
MEAVLCYGKRDVRVGEVARPKAGPGQVVVEMKRVGICGSDIHMWNEDYGSLAFLGMELPFGLGHEGSGVVAEVGDGVEGLKVGDRVALEPPYGDGKALVMLRAFHVHPANLAHKISDGVSFEEAAMVEPFAVAFHAVKRAGVKAGDNVLIVGAGPIGVLALLAARTFGPKRIVVTDVNQQRLATAKGFGADATAEGAEVPADAAAKALVHFGGELPEVVIDAAGHESTLATALHAVRPGGVVTVVGVARPAVSLPYLVFVPKEIDLRSAYYYGKPSDYPGALALVQSGKVDLKPLVSHHIKLADVSRGYEWCAKGTDAHGGVVNKIMFDLA